MKEYSHRGLIQILHSLQKTLKKEGSSVFTLLKKQKNRNLTMFEVLGAVIYCIIDKHVCLDYIFLQKDQNILSFDKSFLDAYYNEISGISTPELLMNIVSCNLFVKENTPTVTLTCRRNLVSYYLSQSFVIFQNILKHRVFSQEK